MKCWPHISNLLMHSVNTNASAQWYWWITQHKCALACQGQCLCWHGQYNTQRMFFLAKCWSKCRQKHQRWRKKKTFFTSKMSFYLRCLPWQDSCGALVQNRWRTGCYTLCSPSISAREKTSVKLHILAHSFLFVTQDDFTVGAFQAWNIMLQLSYEMLTVYFHV